MSEIATLSALVHGKQTAISFRHVSSLLSIPTRRAQTLLADFSASDPTLTALWCVTEPHPKTGVLRTSLTTTPPADARKQIWAVGPPSAASAPSPQAVWFASDAARDRDLVTQPSHIKNELRDGRWNRIRSETTSWDAQLDPRLGGDERLAKGPGPALCAKSNSSSLLASVKAKAKGKKTKATVFMGGAFKSASGAPASLFMSKPLGGDAVKKMREVSPKETTEKKKRVNKMDVGTEPVSLKEEETSASGEKQKSKAKKKGKRRMLAKKPRRVVDDESDKEDRNPLDEEDEGDDEEQERMRELEQEAAEKETADAERAELEKEVMDLNGDDADEEPESPELKELGDDYAPNHEATSPIPRREELAGSPEVGKRSFWETFGDGPNGTKRVRKEVEETVEENGYFVTRRVMKTFDEQGNEVEDPELEKTIAEANRIVGGAHNEQSPATPRIVDGVGRSPASPLKPKNLHSTKAKLAFSGLKKDRTKDSKRHSSKLGTTTKKTPKKKLKGNIMSYFGKKA